MSTAAATTPKPGKPLIVHGVTMPPDKPRYAAIMASPLLRELFFFRHSHMLPGYNGPGTYQHARNAVEMLWMQKGRNLLVWHPHMETALEEYCNTGARGEILLTGPAADGKTTGAAIYSLLFWMSDPMNTGVLVCSTTLPGLKRRLWGDIRKLYLAVQGVLAPSNLVDSKTSIESEKGNSKRGIFGIAVAEGNEAKAMGKIIGFHPPNILVVVDELTDVSEAIVEALTNLFTGKKKAVFIGIGNATSIFDSHGKMCEPADGWGSVNVESERWETRRGGVCIHTDGMKSPNVVAGRVIYPFLLTREDIASTARDYGDNSPQMWRMRRGFWCPENASQTVLTESLIHRFGAMTKEPWENTEIEVFAGLDPAFGGGDRCVLTFARVGKNAKGERIVELGEQITINTNVTTNTPVHFQIAARVKAECVARGVDPRHFGMDSTGEGGGLLSILAETWGPEIHPVEFGGKCSELPVSEMNPKPCRDEYDRKVTELWYAFRSAVMLGQVRGLSAEAAREFCNRQFVVESKIKLEKKADMKLRMGRSSDFADSVVVVLDVIRNRGLLAGSPSRIRRTLDRNWQALVAEFSMGESDYAEDSIAAIA